MEEKHKSDAELLKVSKEHLEVSKKHLEVSEEHRDVGKEQLKTSMPKKEQRLLGQKKKQGAIGGQYSYRFTPTSLGTAVSVKCACGKEKNVTEYDSW